LIGITGQGSENDAFFECGLGTHSYLIDNAIVRQYERNAAIVGDTTQVRLIAGDAADIP